MFTKLHDSGQAYSCITKFIAKNNETTTSASKTTLHFGDLMQN